MTSLKNRVRFTRPGITSIPQTSLRMRGRVRAVRGTTVFAELPAVAVGDMCQVKRRHAAPLAAEVVAINGEVATLAPLGSTIGIFTGAEVEADESRVTIPVGDWLLGRVIDPFGRALDGDNRKQNYISNRSLYANPPDPLSRKIITQQMVTGVKVIDSCVPLGYGQRICVMAQAGVGKSTLLGMVVRNAEIDVAVVALVGERGREVREFIEDNLGQTGMARSVVVVATSDEPSMVRQLAPYTATTIAEYFRDKGLRVLLVVDSLTRMARAMRETGLAAGEPPVRHGFPPSVYTELPRLLERSGTAEKGSITALYTLLVESEEAPDPLAEEVKSVLDGHIYLSQKIATSGVRPSVSATRSVSRVSERVTSHEHQSARAILLRALARIERDRDLMLLGGVPDPELKQALELEPLINRFLNQSTKESSSISQTNRELVELSEKLSKQKTNIH